MKKILYSAFVAMGMLSLASCSNEFEPKYDYEEPIPDKTPFQNDDYISVSSWANRYQWNLANVHDPSVVLADDGYYYMYQTDASYGNAHAYHGHFFCRRSRDLVNWEFLGPTMHGIPVWLKGKLNELRDSMGVAPNTADFDNDQTYQQQFGYWAPCVRKLANGIYRMYYAVTVPGTIDGEDTWSERCFIGMMETATPALTESWVDKGYVLTNYSDRGLDFRYKADDWNNCYFKYNCIDPSYIITPEGEHWLIYGSWHYGFAAVQINPETGKTISEQGLPWGAENEAAYGKLVYTRQMGNRWQAAEAPEVIYRDGYYYLFMAYDGLDVPYNTRVVRSRNIDGPYYGIDGTDVTNSGGDAFPIVTHPYKFSGDHGWVGISHCAIFDDGKGNYYYVSQQRFPAGYNGNANSNALMLGGVRSIRWTSTGWPVVMPERYNATEQTAISDDDIVGTWEHIDLGYQYGVMKEAVDMEFSADHKITSGPWRGASWSLDASTNTLTVNGIELLLQREADWEANRTKNTIVYAGINGTKTYWGKKK